MRTNDVIELKRNATDYSPWKEKKDMKVLLNAYRSNSRSLIKNVRAVCPRDERFNSSEPFDAFFGCCSNQSFYRSAEKIRNMSC